MREHDLNMLERDRHQEELEQNRLEILKHKQKTGFQLTESEEKLLNALEAKINLRQSIEEK